MNTSSRGFDFCPRLFGITGAAFFPVDLISGKTAALKLMVLSSALTCSLDQPKAWLHRPAFRGAMSSKGFNRRDTRSQAPETRS